MRVYWPDAQVAFGPGGIQQADLAGQGVTHVLDLCADEDGVEPGPCHPGVRRLALPSQDDGSPKSDLWFHMGIDFGREALAGGGRLYCHCRSGSNRSPSMVLAILMTCRGLDAAAAERAIRRARRTVVLAYRDDAVRAAATYAADGARPGADPGPRSEWWCRLPGGLWPTGAARRMVARFGRQPDHRPR